jgi:hypothetical protein
MKCKTCWKELNPYTPKPYWNINCENKNKTDIPDFLKEIFNFKK